MTCPGCGTMSFKDTGTIKKYHCDLLFGVRQNERVDCSCKVCGYSWEEEPYKPDVRTLMAGQVHAAAECGSNNPFPNDHDMVAIYLHWKHLYAATGPFAPPNRPKGEA